MQNQTQQALEVLVFALDGQKYCVDIESVEEIVDGGEVTDVPDAPPHVEGVMDLRGRTTTIVNPRSVFGLSVIDDHSRIIVFDPDAFDDEKAVGWLVDDARRVTRIPDDDVTDPGITASACVEGLIKRDGEFVILVDPTEVGR